MKPKIPVKKNQKGDSKRSDKIVKGQDNVFDDLGYENAREHEVKAYLVSQIARLIDDEDLTQREAAARMNIDQPKVSAMLSGHFRGFSVYRLMCFLQMLGRDVSIVTRIPTSRIQTTEEIYV